MDMKRWLATGGCTMYAIKHNGKKIQRSHYVDELFWTCVEMVRKGSPADSLDIVDELSDDEVITEDVGSFLDDVGALRRG